jgi:hypothetical protein
MSVNKGAARLGNFLTYCSMVKQATVSDQVCFQILSDLSNFLDGSITYYKCKKKIAKEFEKNHVSFSKESSLKQKLQVRQKNIQINKKFLVYKNHAEQFKCTTMSKEKLVKAQSVSAKIQKISRSAIEKAGKLKFLHQETVPATTTKIDSRLKKLIERCQGECYVRMSIEDETDPIGHSVALFIDKCSQNPAHMSTNDLFMTMHKKGNFTAVHWPAALYDSQEGMTMCVRYEDLIQMVHAQFYKDAKEFTLEVFEKR